MLSNDVPLLPLAVFCITGIITSYVAGHTKLIKRKPFLIFVFAGLYTLMGLFVFQIKGMSIMGFHSWMMGFMISTGVFKRVFQKDQKS